MATPQFSGPLDYAVIVVPRRARVGAALGLLLDRVDGGAIELLDLEVIDRDASRLPLSALSEAEGLDASAFEGAESDVLGDDDVAAIAEELGEDELAIAVVYEDRSLAAVAEALAAEGGRMLWSGGIDVADLEAAVAAEPGGDS